MHAVQCPNCNKTLRLKKPVTGARMRCRHCGEVFVGTSQDRAEPAKAAPAPKPLQTPPPLHTPAEPAAPAGVVDADGNLLNAPPPPGGYAPPPPGPGPRGYPEEERPRFRRKKPSVVPLVICCVALPAIIAVAIFAVWNYNNPPLVLKDGHGNITFQGRVPRAEYEEKIQKHKEQQRRGPGYMPPPEDPMPPGGTDPGPLPPPERPDPGPGPVTPPARTPGGTPGDVSPPAPTIPAGDQYVVVNVDNQPVTRDETPTSGFLVGTVQNKYEAPLTSVSIHLYTHTADGKPRAPITGRMAYIPPKTTVPFSIQYDGLPWQEIGTVIGRASGVQGAAKNAVCWAVPEHDIRMSKDGNEVVLDVLLKNPAGAALRNVKLFYDFFDQQSVQVSYGKTRSAGTAPTTLSAGQEARITIRYRPSLDESSVGLIQSWYLRVWAEK